MGQSSERNLPGGISREKKPVSSHRSHGIHLHRLSKDSIHSRIHRRSWDDWNEERGTLANPQYMEA